MSDHPPAEPGTTAGATPARKRTRLGKLATYLASFAGGAAINDLSGTLGYHGLAGAVALLGVITAANWIRGLDPRARLSRLAPWLFLAPAACAAATAAFSSGVIASILTVAAAMLTVGAVVIARELQSAARLLAGVALIVAGAAVIAAGTASFADGNVLLGAAIALGGIALLVGGIAHIGDRDAHAGVALIVAGAAVIVTGILVIATRAEVVPESERTIGILGIFWFGTGLIQNGIVLISGGRHGWLVQYPKYLQRHSVTAKAAAASAGAILTAVIVKGSNATLVWAGLVIYLVTAIVSLAAVIGSHNIVNRIRQAIDRASKAPQAAEEHGTQLQPDSNVE